MDKITIERETLERAIAAIEPVSAYGRVGTRDVDQAAMQKAIVALRAALAAQPAEPTMDTVLRNAARRSATVIHPGRLAAQPADAQPTGQSPCARHCEAPAFDGEIRRLKRELQTQAERIRVLREAIRNALDASDAAHAEMAPKLVAQGITSIPISDLTAKAYEAAGALRAALEATK